MTTPRELLARYVTQSQMSSFFIDKMGIVNVKSYGAVGDGVTDDTAAIQAAVDYAATKKIELNDAGSLYYSGNSRVIFPVGKYIITGKIIVKQGVDIDMRGAVFFASPSNKTVNCFDMTLEGFRQHFYGGTFVYFNKAITINTGNLECSRILFSEQYFQQCNTGIDMVSFDSSRSTNVVIENFISWLTNLFVKVHSDMVNIRNGWITHSGYNGPAIYNQGFTKIEHVVGVPALPQPGANPRWIDNYATDYNTPGGDTTMFGERGLYIDHCRFGPEGGDMPIVYNYADHITNFSNNKPTIIEINNSFCSSRMGTIPALIVLFKMPNRIKLSNISGMTNLGYGMIHADNSFDTTTLSNTKQISIEIDETGYYHKDVPMIDSDLYRFLKTKENQNTVYRQTFKDGKTHKRYIPADAGIDAGTGRPLSSVTIPVKTPTVEGISYSEQFGLGFLLSINASDTIADGTCVYKNSGLYYVSITGGYTSSRVKRVNSQSIALFNGGVAMAEAPGIKSVVWATSGTQDIATTANENIKITFFGLSTLSYVSIIPTYGYDSDVS